MSNLEDFLVKAKKNTYGTQKGKIPSSRKHSKDLAYQDGNYYYLDSYFGEKCFSGEEIVYYNDIPIWSMNYYGKLLKENIQDGFIETLRGALQKVTKEVPFRGIEKYINGNFTYICSNGGAVDFFRGIEKIFYDDEEIYRLYFHGGIIK